MVHVSLFSFVLCCGTVCYRKFILPLEFMVANLLVYIYVCRDFFVLTECSKFKIQLVGKKNIAFEVLFTEVREVTFIVWEGFF